MGNLDADLGVTLCILFIMTYVNNFIENKIVPMDIINDND